MLKKNVEISSQPHVRLSNFMLEHFEDELANLMRVVALYVVSAPRKALKHGARLMF